MIIVLSFSFSTNTFIIDDKNVKDTVRFEFIKSLLQLLVVFIIGGIISILIKLWETNKEQTRIRIETWENYLNRIGLVYWNVKRARRSLTAIGLTTKYDNQPKILSQEQVNLYIDRMEVLNNSQIELESLMIETGNLPKIFSVHLVSQYLEKAESYLRKIVKEYKATLPSLKNNIPVQFISLERLNEFTTSTDKEFKYEKYKVDVEDKEKKYKEPYRFENQFAGQFKMIFKVYEGIDFAKVK